MISLTLADVIEGLTGHKVDALQPIKKVVIDSREVTAGAVFIALPGDNTDGHLFINDAFQRGAIMAIGHKPLVTDRQTIIIEANRPFSIDLLHKNQLPIYIKVEDSLKGLQQLATFWLQKFKPRVIGITGSVGKSVTKELIWAVLSKRFNTLKNKGNFNNEIGLPLTLLELNDRHKHVVLEMGMYDIGEIALLCGIAPPDVGVITNIGATHLERLGTVERIAQAKTELVQALPPAKKEIGQGGVAILNYDDNTVLKMMNETQAHVITYGLSPKADLWATDVTSAGLDGIRFVFHYQNEIIHAHVPLLGRHSVHTALRATLVGLAEGLDWEEIISGLQSLPSTTQLRLVSVPGPNNSILLDDTYNASPASTIAALNLLDDLVAVRKIAVLGDMLELGSFEEAGHRKVGCRAADVVDLLIVIGQRSRYIAKEARVCGLDSRFIMEMEDKQAIISYLKDSLGQGDIVLVKGSNAQHLDEIVSALQEKESN